MEVYSRLSRSRCGAPACGESADRRAQRRREKVRLWEGVGCRMQRIPTLGDGRRELIPGEDTAMQSTSKLVRSRDSLGRETWQQSRGGDADKL
jgi:hypothetical protein